MHDGSEHSNDPASMKDTLLPERRTVLERYDIHPGLFAFVALMLVFLLYQVVGGLLALLLFGMTPTIDNVGGFRMATGIGQAVFILLPSLLLLRLATHRPAEYVRLRPPGLLPIVASLIGIFSLQQLLQIYMVIQEKFPLPPELQQRLDEFRRVVEESYKVLLQSSSLPELGWVILIIAIIPALAEELLFRGLVMRSLQQRMGGMRAAVLTGIIFGTYHMNPFSVFPLIALGVYLGFVAYRGDSLWLSVITHFFNNATACVATYIRLDDDAIVTGDPATMSLPLLLGTAWAFGILFYLSIHLFLRVTRQVSDDKTEIPENEVLPGPDDR